MIQIRNITKFYENKHVKHRALYDISFDVDYGDYIFVYGKSGSGKSTLLNILGCIDKFDYGKYIFEEKSIGDFGDFELSRLRNQRFGFIFRDFKLIPELNLFENLCIPLLYSDFPRKEKRDRVLNCLSMVSMDKYKYFNVCDISKKDRYKICIARALVGGARIILADDPFRFLDRKDSKEMFDLLFSLNKQGVTIVLSGDEFDESIKANKFIKLKDGMI